MRRFDVRLIRSIEAGKVKILSQLVLRNIVAEDEHDASQLAESQMPKGWKAIETVLAR